MALFLPVGPSSYMFIHKTPCDDVVAQFGGVWSDRAGGGLDSPLFREDILDDLACRQFRVRRGNRRQQYLKAVRNKLRVRTVPTRSGRVRTCGMNGVEKIRRSPPAFH